MEILLKRMIGKHSDLLSSAGYSEEEGILAGNLNRKKLTRVHVLLSFLKKLSY